MDNSTARAIAFYLPQFHPIPENDEWWGKGFTEWTNVAKAKPLFKGHYQPRLPADLGYYDLRLPEVREAQAELARANGIEGFCYWHYWFDGKRLLERPFTEVLSSGNPNFPFCLAWANHSWSGVWSGGDNRRIMEQTYSGRKDHERHFNYLLTAFRDDRYIRVDGKPLMVIYNPLEIPDVKSVLAYWRELADSAKLPGLYFVATLNYGQHYWDAAARGFDAITIWTLWKVLQEGRSCLRRSMLKNMLKNWGTERLNKYVERIYPGLESIYDYGEVRKLLVCDEEFNLPQHPMVIPNWDTTARHGRNATVLHNSTPEAFRLHLRDALKVVAGQSEQQRIVFVKSWNEWAEGNHLEPDTLHGNSYLAVCGQELLK